MEASEKICNRCNRKLPINRFDSNGLKRDGTKRVYSLCKNCKVMGKKTWLSNNPVARKDRWNKYRRRHIEKARARNKKRYWENRAKELSRRKDLYHRSGKHVSREEYISQLKHGKRRRAAARLDANKVKELHGLHDFGVAGCRTLGRLYSVDDSVVTRTIEGKAWPWVARENITKEFLQCTLAKRCRDDYGFFLRFLLFKISVAIKLVRKKDKHDTKINALFEFCRSVLSSVQAGRP